MNKTVLVIFFLFVFLFGIASDSWAQGYIVKYGYSMNLPPVLRSKTKRIIVKELTYSLGKSKYVELYTMVDKDIDHNLKWLNLDRIVYKDFVQNCYVYIGNNLGNKRAVREYFDDIFHWNIDVESDSIIAGFHCQKATTLHFGDSVVAWYAKDIPIMDGPAFYAGLPGLILWLKDGYGVTEVLDIQMVKTTIEIQIPKRSQYISYKKFATGIGILSPNDKN